MFLPPQPVTVMALAKIRGSASRPSLPAKVVFAACQGRKQEDGQNRSDAQVLMVSGAEQVPGMGAPAGRGGFEAAPSRPLSSPGDA